MKKTLQIFATIICVMFCTFASAQVLTVKFTGRDQTGQHYVKLDHVKTFNLDQLWEEVLYFPDTTLVLGGVGIIDYGNSSSSQLEQNVPNPFDGTTNFTLYLREGADVLLEIFDLMGKSIVNQYYTNLSAGAHLFSANLNNPQVYILKVSVKNEQMHLKMVNEGYAAENSISYVSTSSPNGEFESGAKDSQALGIYPFQNGDELQHTGYTVINGVEYKSETITQRQTESETMILHFNLTPTVITNTVSGITGTSAVCGGMVNYTGEATVVSRGICWSTSNWPTINNNHTTDGSGTGSFTSTMANLNPGTTYHVRAYATSSADITGYGEQVTFNTLATVPTVITSAVTNITDNSATCGGHITSDGGAAITARGVCWSTNQNPTIADYHTTDGSGTGTFTSSITGLSPNTTYYVRAYATNSEGTSYGEQKMLHTLCNVVNISISGNTNINPGQSTTLTASGANTYQWSTNASTASITVSPTVITTYTVTGTNSYGCTGTASITVTINSTPTVTTNNVSNINAFSATCGGIVTNDGGTSVTARGVCWNTNQNPLITNAHTTNGTGTGSFSSNITGLTPNTTYYVRAYATNSVGTSYGEQKSLTTLCNTVNINITGNTTINYGQNTTLSASGANSYQWSTNASTASITVSPTSTTSYTVVGTNNYGCTGCASVTVTVNSIVPTVSTNNISNIGITTATCGSSVNSNGGAEIISRGVCWSTNQNPTIADNHTSDGNGTGSFTSNITNLSPGTVYHVRAYATNSIGTAYGTDLQFTTLPSATTLPATYITSISAICSGTINTSTPITECGICWDTIQNPTINSNHTTDWNSTESFSHYVTNLSPGTTYYIRAYVTNNTNIIVYGNQLSFTTSTDGESCQDAVSLTDYDGNIYNTVVIGSQCWMRENLRTTHYANGASINLWQSIYEYYPTWAYRRYPNNDSLNVPLYGQLYNWPAVMHGASSSDGNPSNVQGICPNGWHVPSNAEWMELTDYVSSQSQFLCDGNTGYIAKALSSTTGWSGSTTICSVGRNMSANNATNFSAMPAGSGTEEFGNAAYFYSSTEVEGHPGSAFSLVIYQGSISANLNSLNQDTRRTHSVRCLRDESSMILPTVTTSSASNILNNSVLMAGNITYGGMDTIIARGFCWSTSQNPTINDNHTVDGSGIGEFTSNITNLSSNTTYYIRAYATINTNITLYGNQESFTTRFGGDPCPNAATLTDYDGHVYHTVQIGNQCWMKENLKTTHYANGTSINWSHNTSTTIPYLYYPDNNSSNIDTYGYLYNWAAVMHGAASCTSNPSGVQGVCPNGWHVPSDAEWTQLANYVGSIDDFICGNETTFIAKALAATTNWPINNSSNCFIGNVMSTNNATGFSALPAGRCTFASFGLCEYVDFGYQATFWSTTSASGDGSWGRYLSSDNNKLCTSCYGIYCGLSVRCVKD